MGEREEQFEAGQASAIPRIRELEAKNGELEKELAYFKAIYNPLINGAAIDTNRINGLEKKLEIAVDGLEVIESYRVSVSIIAREALAAIKDA